MNHSMRAAETVARIDGDAFTVLVLEVRAAGDAAIIAERLLQTISRPLSIDCLLYTPRCV